MSTQSLVQIEQKRLIRHKGYELLFNDPIQVDSNSQMFLIKATEEQRSEKFGWLKKRKNKVSLFATFLYKVLMMAQNFRYFSSAKLLFRVLFFLLINDICFADFIIKSYRLGSRLYSARRFE